MSALKFSTLLSIPMHPTLLFLNRCARICNFWTMEKLWSKYILIPYFAINAQRLNIAFLIHYIYAPQKKISLMIFLLCHILFKICLNKTFVDSLVFVFSEIRFFFSSETQPPTEQHCWNVVVVVVKWIVKREGVLLLLLSFRLTTWNVFSLQ
jgi:hypothetical protein